MSEEGVSRNEREEREKAEKKRAKQQRGEQGAEPGAERWLNFARYGTLSLGLLCIWVAFFWWLLADEFRWQSIVFYIFGGVLFVAWVVITAVTKKATAFDIARIVALILGTHFAWWCLGYWFVNSAFGWVPKAFAVAAIGLLAFYVAATWEKLMELLGRPTTVPVLFTVLLCIFALVVLQMLNYLAYRYSYRVDLSKNKQFSLAEQTLTILRDLDADVQITAFVTPSNMDYFEIRDLLREYRMNSRRVHTELIDPNKNPARAKAENARDGTIIVKCGDRKEEIMFPDEQKLTSAILAVTTGEKTKLYFLQGHGEKTIDYGASADNSYTVFKRNLENQQYECKTLTFDPKKPKVPDDCACLIVAGPRMKLSDDELEAIHKYLDEGGSLLLLLEPQLPNPFGVTIEVPDFKDFLADYDVEVLDGVVVDSDPTYNNYDPRSLIIRRPESHPITKDLINIHFLMARPLKVAEPSEEDYETPYGGPPPSKARALLLTSSSSWAESNPLAPMDELTQDGDEESGPFALGIAVDLSQKPPQYPGMPPPPEEEGPKAKLVVFGDSKFLSDLFVDPGRMYALANPMNLVLGLKAVGWLVGDKQRVTIPPKSTETEYITLSKRQSRTVLLLHGTIVLLLPVIGGVVWWIRR